MGFGAVSQTRGSGSIALTIWGDHLVGWALVLLLRGESYQAKFLPASSSSEPRSLEGTQLLVLTPTPQLSTKKREALLASLVEDIPRATKLAGLELVMVGQKVPEGRTQNDSWYRVPWPCGLEKLEQHIEAAAFAVR